jgi:outer membrane receptor protein involved in Fe transport
VSPLLHWNSANYDGGPADIPLTTTVRSSSRYIGGQATISVSQSQNEIHAGLFGFAEKDTQLFAVGFNDQSGENFSARETPSGEQLGLFVEDKFHASSWFTLTGGVRQTFFSGGISETATSPRIGATVQIPKVEWMLRGFYGRFYQAPPLATASGPLLNFVTSSNFGFTPLLGERDEEYQVGITIPVRDWVFDADEFRTRATNFFDHNPIGNSNVFFPLTIEGARIRGWELTFRSPHAWQHVHIHLAYSHQHADGIGGINGGLTDFSPAEGTFPLDHDQRNTLSAGATTTLAHGIFGGGNVYYGSGFPDEGGPAYLPGHTTVDLMLGKSFGDSLSISLNILNAGNERVLIDNSVTFGGTHFNNPREVYAEVRYRFHY